MKPIQVVLMGFIALCTAITPWAVAADSSKPQADRLSFQHEDWELMCDNTRTCRAAGYQLETRESENGDSEPVSMLIERPAGPNTPVQIWLQLGGEKASGSNASMRVGKLLLRTVPTLTKPQEIGEWGKTPPASLDKNLVRALLPMLLKNETAVIKANKGVWTLSLQGLSAVLLKMDDFQGRLNTPGALVKPGNRPESEVKPALTLPVVHKALPVPNKPGDQALAKQIFSTVQLAPLLADCNMNDSPKPDELKVYRLTAHKFLLSLDTSCGVAVYDGTSIPWNWIANDRPPYQPLKIEAEGEFDAKDGSISAGQKSGPNSGCYFVRRWHFTGEDFVLTKETADGMCRGFEGGAWNLLHYRAQPAPTSKPTAKSSEKP